MEKKPPQKKQVVKAMALASSIISYLVGPILVGVFAGRWLDSYFQTEPLFLIVGLLLGIAAGGYGLFRLVRQFLGEEDK